MPAWLTGRVGRLGGCRACVLHCARQPALLSTPAHCATTPLAASTGDLCRCKLY